MERYEWVVIDKKEDCDPQQQLCTAQKQASPKTETTLRLRAVVQVKFEKIERLGDNIQYCSNPATASIDRSEGRSCIPARKRKPLVHCHRRFKLDCYARIPRVPPSNFVRNFATTLRQRLLSLEVLCLDALSRCQIWKTKRDKDHRRFAFSYWCPSIVDRLL